MKIFYSIIFALVFDACSRPAQTPIVFSLQTDDVSMILQLDTNKTFSYKTKHTKSIAFNESGTYSITDSSLVLKYNNPSYTYNCFEIPLVNDTFVFVKYKEVLYLVHSNQPNAEQKTAFMTALAQSINNHTFNLFENDFNLPYSSGNVELIYK
ncbi:MAG: hypothetical protein LBR55_01895 [Bacteroidales bacterium]|jgi:hypothetical protein|nr:hypothetical protein [Bacteroidales bacterium]